MAEAMYVAIADDLRLKIESGELAPGKQLKTEVELREEYGREGMVSRNTVRDAIKLLVARGLVETRPGQGTFVTRKLMPFVSKLTVDPEAGGVEDTVYESEVQRQGRSPEESRPRVEVQMASGLVCSQLQLDQGSQVITRHKERRIDGTPFSVQTTFYPMDLLAGNPAASRLLEARNVEGGMVNYLRAHLGINQVGWRDTIIARQPTPQERAFFDLPGPVQVSMFEFRRTAYGEDQKPIRLTITVYSADRNQFEIEAGDVPEPPAPGDIQPACHQTSESDCKPRMSAGKGMAAGKVASRLSAEHGRPIGSSSEIEFLHPPPTLDRPVAVQEFAQVQPRGQDAISGTRWAAA